MRNLQFLMMAPIAALLAVPSSAIMPEHDHAHEPRNYDARIELTKSLAEIPPKAVQVRALDELRVELPELAVTFDQTTGATRSIYSRSGYLTDGFGAAETHLDTALDYVKSRLPALGLSESDLEGFEVTDNVFTKVTGASHIYLRQVHQKLPVYNGQLHINVNRDGKIISVNNAFVPDIAAAVNRVVPSLRADEAVFAAGLQLGATLKASPKVLSQSEGDRRLTRISGEGLSRDTIEAELMWLPVRAGDVRLVWNFQVQTLDKDHWFDMTVDAHSGETLTRFDWISSGYYVVYEAPVESPIHTNPSPPQDARSYVVHPEDATASPNGWFSGGVMDGNNVHACLDTDADDVCDTPEISCFGSANDVCAFTISLNTAPSTYQKASVANLFYWNNLIHDIQYHYGFDESAGNFQEDNFGRGGVGGDSVNADAQDGEYHCNGHFATPKDGQSPRMQMYTCSYSSPTRDGVFDNLVTVHEYGHGISNRQVGGPSNVSCLDNVQQAGEGWSDWLGLWYTADAGDTGPQPRGVGSYLANLSPTGTIRGKRYSTDDAINDWTYQSIRNAAIPHGVGAVWAQVLWKAYWMLVDQHGYSSDKYNATGGAGNQRAMLYVNEGLKNTACSPTFIDNRDAILQAAVDNHGGEDVCALWEVFADFGLGEDAVSGGANSRSATNGFKLPISCVGLQAAEVSTNHVPKTVSLSGFTTPRIAAGPPTYNGDDPTPVELLNITSSSFQHHIREWDYLDNVHSNAESMGYLVVEDGAQLLGTLPAEAGSENLNHNWTTVTFEQSFTSAPVVLATVGSINGGQAVAARLRNITTTGFEIRLQEEEGNNGTHSSRERVDWIAIEPGTARVGNQDLIVGRTARTVTDAWHTINYASLSNPIFVASIQTFHGPDPAALRSGDPGSTSIQVKVEEEKSRDTEVGHAAEVIGYVLIGN